MKKITLELRVTDKWLEENPMSELDKMTKEHEVGINSFTYKIEDIEEEQPCQNTK